MFCAFVCVYLSVTATLLCPKISCTVLILAPLSNILVAAVCLKSWNTKLPVSFLTSLLKSSILAGVISSNATFLNIEDLEILECEIEKEEEEILPSPIIPKIEIKKEKSGKYNPAVKPLFKTSRERYEYLMEHGCTCNDDRVWLIAYKEFKEFKEYETKICTD